MEKIIRILSYQNAQNFGAVLQAYGLQQSLKRFGYNDVSFINYNPDYLRKRYLVFPSKWYKPKAGSKQNLISFYINLPFKVLNRWRKNRLFSKSRKRLLIQSNDQYRQLEDITGVRCDYLILGSDQIWSTWITGVPDPVFYGKGDYKGLKRIISYAPSSELSTFNNPHFLSVIQDYLKGIDFISVREMMVCKVFQDKIGISPKICVDPTILCGVDDFDKISSKRMIKGNYILVYSYSNWAGLVQSLIKTIPEFKSYEIHYIAFGPSEARDTFKKNSHNEISVEEFVSLFKFASFVITNSFHGLAFSLLFNRKFAVAYEEGKSSRCESLLQQINATDKLIYNADEMNWSNFDFDEYNRNMDRIREDSSQFLINSLSTV